MYLYRGTGKITTELLVDFDTIFIFIILSSTQVYLKKWFPKFKISRQSQTLVDLHTHL